MQVVNHELAFCPFQEIELHEQELLIKAAQARCNAQAPYSNYLVGAAVLNKDGNIYIGCNVERCTYNQTTHAEQNAVDTMIASQGPCKIEAVAFIAAPSGTDIRFPYEGDGRTADKLVAPCGHCLQVIWENCFRDPGVRIVSLMPSGRVCATTIGEALPIRFGPEDLGIKY